VPCSRRNFTFSVRVMFCNWVTDELLISSLLVVIYFMLVRDEYRESPVIH